jgi:TolC family type I secretion outer membrane protein
MKLQKMRMTRLLFASALVAQAVVLSAVAHGETLTEALVSAYQTNPTLRADRARQRGTDEQVPQALSGWRPTVTTQGTASHSWTDTSATSKSHLTSEGVTIQLSQPLFRGFKTVNGVKAAESSVEAGRQNLLVVEQDVLFQTVQAYMNVIRDREILSLRMTNVSFLRQQLKASNDRFAVGEITRTDVSQAQASLAQAQGFVASAQASLASSEAAYIKLVGHKPGKLVYPGKPRLPGSMQDAFTQADTVNPNILAAASVADAARYDIEVAKGDLLPSASLQATGSLQHHPQKGLESSQGASVEGVLTVPLYEAGLNYSRVRQAKQVASQQRINIIVAGRAVREGVMVAWNNYLAAGQNIRANKAQVSSSALALDGVRQEYLVGSRTTFDVLNAQSTLISAKIALVAAQRDAVVAAYQILGAVGKLTAPHLRLPVEYYDPEENYHAVRNKWIGTGVNTVE